MINMPTTESFDLLQRSLIGRLGMVGADGRPYTIPLRFVWHKGAVFVRVAHDGRKHDALEHQQRVCFEVDEVREDFSHYASVIIEGAIQEIDSVEEKKAALVAMNDKYTRLAGMPSPGPDPVVNGVALRKLQVEKLSGRKREPGLVRA